MAVINIIHGDCMEAMKAMPDKAYDLAIVDPPYSPLCNLHGGHPSDGKYGWGGNWASNKHLEWNKRPGPEYFSQLRRVSKNQIIWGGNYFMDDLHDTSCIIVWDKGQRDFSLADAEIAWSSFQKPVRVFSYSRAENNRTKRIHVNQKPVRLYEWLLKKYAKPGDKILDTHGGSCSIAIACDIMGFDLDCYEIDLDYWTAATERLQRHKRQEVLPL